MSKTIYNYICSNAYRSLNFIRRNISSFAPINVKKQLYISLVRSHLTFCSQLWRPHLIKDILTIENVQRRDTKFIHDNSMDYKSRLITLEILPLMYWFELQDILFLVKYFKTPSDNFDIFDFISSPSLILVLQLLIN